MIKASMNRLANVDNPYQGQSKKVLCVCSAGLLRSPTAALVLSRKPYNYNTRAAGIDENFALIPVDEALLRWADEIVCMNQDQRAELRDLLFHIYKIPRKKPVICLDIEDSFEYRNPKLMRLIRKKYNAALAEMNRKVDEECQGYP